MLESLGGRGGRTVVGCMVDSQRVGEIKALSVYETCKFTNVHV